MQLIARHATAELTLRWQRPAFTRIPGLHVRMAIDRCQYHSTRPV